MPHGVRGSVKASQAADPNAVLDRPLAHAELEQLTACDDAVLGGREACDRLVVAEPVATDVGFSTQQVCNSTFVGHGAEDRPTRRAGGARGATERACEADYSVA